MPEGIVAEKTKKKPKVLNIKNEKTCRLARKLAKLTGESIAVAVKVALKEKLKRVRAEKARGAALRKIAMQGRKMFKGPHIDHAELLYDDNGLPK
jgi:antitoxin VapB